MNSMWHDHWKSCVGLIWAGLIIFGLLTVASCGKAASADAPENPAGVMKSFVVPLPDGRTVICVGDKYTDSTQSPSCDWGHAR